MLLPRLKAHRVHRIFRLPFVQEWGASCPHEFLDAYRLEYDQSWTPLKDVERRTDEINFVDRIINHQLALTDAANPLGLTSQTAAVASSQSPQAPPVTIHEVPVTSMD